MRYTRVSVKVSALLLAASLPALGEDTIKSKVIDAETHSMTETIADTKGRVLKKTRFFFDEKNWSKGAVHFDAAGNVRYKELFRRDGTGRVLEARLFSKDDKPLGKRVYNYDGAGQVARIDDYDANGQLIAKEQPQVQRAQPVRKKR